MIRSWRVTTIAVGTSRSAGLAADGIETPAAAHSTMACTRSGWRLASCEATALPSE
jgi:hypothetical protein